jgi:hypothetical protein
LHQRGGKRPQEERRGCSGGILLLSGEGRSGGSCYGGIRISAEKGISQRANCLVLLRWYSKYAEHLRKPFFFTGGILLTQSTTRLFCSAGNPPPRENPVIKRTRTDDILKKFKFKMNSKLKINVKRDRTNFRSI